MGGFLSGYLERFLGEISYMSFFASDVNYNELARVSFLEMLFIFLPVNFLSNSSDFPGISQ